MTNENQQSIDAKSTELAINNKLARLFPSLMEALAKFKESLKEDDTIGHALYDKARQEVVDLSWELD